MIETDGGYSGARQSTDAVRRASSAPHVGSPRGRSLDLAGEVVEHSDAFLDRPSRATSAAYESTLKLVREYMRVRRRQMNVLVEFAESGADLLIFILG